MMKAVPNHPHIALSRCSAHTHALSLTEREEERSHASEKSCDWSCFSATSALPGESLLRSPLSLILRFAGGIHNDGGGSGSCDCGRGGRGDGGCAADEGASAAGWGEGKGMVRLELFCLCMLCRETLASNAVPDTRCPTTDGSLSASSKLAVVDKQAVAACSADDCTDVAVGIFEEEESVQLCSMRSTACCDVIVDDSTRGAECESEGWSLVPSAQESLALSETDEAYAALEPSATFRGERASVGVGEREREVASLESFCERGTARVPSAKDARIAASANDTRV
mmetsp:Transcript_2954/g.5002  ORF Transcript_2954/g.5002 Transcript_2954/m.5002 type:complete len:284 (-) Transcript_2954:469-1320(-)